MKQDTEKKAILVVSFGTSFAKTRVKTIYRMEADFAEAFPDYKVYRAWTSKKIIAKLLRRDGIRIPTVKEAVAQMIADGVTHVIVQPTHLVDGIENEQMKEDVESCAQSFSSLVFGEPLLTTAEDQRQAIEAVMEEFKDRKAEDALKELGYSHAFLGTVEAYPSLDTLLEKVVEFRPGKVLLAPFMFVAGDHAIHDMSGEGRDSWRRRFEAAGFTVECIMKGLGEYPGIRRLYIEHARAAKALGKF